MQQTPSPRKAPLLRRQYDVVVAPLASFDTIDLSDDDAPTSNRFKAQKLISSKRQSLELKAVLSKIKPENVQNTQDCEDSKELVKVSEKDNTKLTVDSVTKSKKDVDDNSSVNKETVLDNRIPKLFSENIREGSPRVNEGHEPKSKETTPKRARNFYRRDSSSDSDSSSESDTGGVKVSVIYRQRLPLDKINISLQRPLRAAVRASPGEPEPSPVLIIADPEQLKIASKRKAYEKRLKRLQVTTTPIVRPRSTTPLNVVTLDEYTCLSSPEKSPSFEKLKITLPVDDYSFKSPRKRGENVFDFNEELLFSHTRSAVVSSDEKSGVPSPKRILLPPSLTPTGSPSKLVGGSPSLSPRFTHTHTNEAIQIQNPSNSPKNVNVSNSVKPNWETFDEKYGCGKKVKKVIRKIKAKESKSEASAEIIRQQPELDCRISSNVNRSDNAASKNDIDILTLQDVETDEILTVNIDHSTNNNPSVCDIQIRSPLDVYTQSNSCHNAGNEQLMQKSRNVDPNYDSEVAQSRNSSRSVNNDQRSEDVMYEQPSDYDDVTG